MAILEDNDILFAHKALNVMAGLSDATKRVAGAIIDHFNKRTGQCDPSIERLARLLGMDEKTVRRATTILDEKQIVGKSSHGGKAHRASYLPNWEFFRAVVADWDARMKKGDAPNTPCRYTGTPAGTPAPNRARLSVSTGRNCPVKPGEIALQTLRSNQSKEPVEAEHVETKRLEPASPHQRKPLHGLWKGNAPTSQRSMLLPIRGGRSPSHEDAAKAAAERRWNTAAMALGVGAYTDVLEWMTWDRQEAATRAEMKRRGGGLDFIVSGMQGQRMYAHG
jgi:hypothetical protein